MPVSMEIISLLTASQLENNWEDYGSNHIYVNPIDFVFVLQIKSRTYPHNLNHCTVSFVNVPVTAGNWHICCYGHLTWLQNQWGKEIISVILDHFIILDAEWPLNEFKLWERHFPSLGISHPVPSGARAAVGVQLGFLLLVSMFSTERGFLKGPSVQQMLCSDLPRERGACWEWWDLIPSWGPGSHCLAVMLKLLGGAPVVLFPCLVPSWVFEITLSSSLHI